MAILDISSSEAAEDSGGGERGEDAVEGVGTSSKLNSLNEVFLVDDDERSGKISGKNGKQG